MVIYYPLTCTPQQSNDNILLIFERKTLIFVPNREISGKWMERKNEEI